jgi:signal transduction histidine kinase
MRKLFVTGVKKFWPIFLAVLLFGGMVFFALRFTTYKKDQWEKDAKSRLLEVLMTKKTKLEKALYSRIHYTRSVAAYVSLRPDITVKEFDNLAGELIQNDSIISTMALSPGCIIRAVFPRTGHEAAIGLDLLSHPERREIVEKTIETHESYVAGPVELVEGGIAFISYTPIFDKTELAQNKFWGVTDIVIRQNALLREATVREEEGGHLFALRGYNGSGDEGPVFWGDTLVFASSPVTVDIDLPYGNWVLAAVPESGWGTYLDQDRVLLFILIISALIISILIGLFTHAIIKIRQNEINLRNLNATKDKLFSIIAHDLKGPFNSLLGFSEVLEEQFESLSDQEVRAILRSIRKTTGETYNLLNNLLNWSQLQRGTIRVSPASHSMRDMAQNSIHLLSSMAEKKEISISNEINLSHFALIDLDTMSLVLRNLLSNAIKFTPKGGKITFSSSKSDDKVEVTVTDNGVGIHQDDLKTIFNLGIQKTTHGTENEKGTGLGLLLCKEFTELNGGDLRVDSTVGHGSRFTLNIPASGD